MESFKTSLVKTLLAGGNFKWAITGGANLYLRGLKSTFNDVDILIEKSGLEFIENLYNLPVTKKTTHQNIKSNFICLTCGGIKYEIMAEPENFWGNIWLKNNYWLKCIESVSFNLDHYNCMSIDYELWVHRGNCNLKKIEEIESRLINFRRSQ